MDKARMEWVRRAMECVFKIEETKNSLSGELVAGSLAEVAEFEAQHAQVQLDVQARGCPPCRLLPVGRDCPAASPRARPAASCARRGEAALPTRGAVRHALRTLENSQQAVGSSILRLRPRPPKWCN